MDNSNDSFPDPVMEREAVETLLSISKAPSPQRMETVMDKIPSETDPWCLPGDPPPLVGPQVQMSVSESPKQPVFNKSYNDVLAMARKMCEAIEQRSLANSPRSASPRSLSNSPVQYTGMEPVNRSFSVVESQQLVSIEETRSDLSFGVQPKKTLSGTSKLAQVQYMYNCEILLEQDHTYMYKIISV